MIVHSVPCLGESGGGPPRSVSQLCNALSEDSQRVGIITAMYPNNPLVELNSAICLRVLQGKGHRFFDRLQSTGFGPMLASVVAEKSVSLVHQHGIWLRSSHEVIHTASKLSLPLVVSPRGMLEPWALNHSKWKKRLAWLLYQKRDLQRVSAFHATAESEAESIRRLGFNQPIAIIPNGVQLPDLTQPSVISHQSASQRTALFLSRINPKKGLPMLLDAWKALAPENWRLVIAGNDDSSHLPLVQAKIAEHGLQDQVGVLGPLFGASKEAAFRDADLFVLPSYSENFGIVVTEALSYQVPVLTTRGCPWQELKTKHCGWWVEPTSEGVLSGLKQAFAASDGDLQRMGQRGRELVEAKYQWPGIAERMLEFYQWLINGGKQPEFVI